MSHPSFWKNEQTPFLAATTPSYLKGEMAEIASREAACNLSHFSLFS